MAGATTHIFRASLRPKLYRDIEIDSGKSLYDLAEGIVGAFDFDLDHAFGFYSKLTGHYFDCIHSPPPDQTGRGMARCGRPRRASARRSVMKAQASTPRRRQVSSTLMVAA